jgi:shikimate kinase
MGCGKSSVGRKLSQQLCCRFIDLDTAIEEREGRTIAEFFAAEGEAGFRNLELKVLGNIISCESGRVKEISSPSHLTPASTHTSLDCHQISKDITSASCHSKTQDRSEANAKGTQHLVLALGGGTVMTPQCADLVRENTFCIYLRASVETLLERLESELMSRPLLRQDTEQTENPQLRGRIEALLAERSATYEKTAKIIIDTDGKSVNAIAHEILANF